MPVQNDYKTLKEFYRNQLLSDCIPFWLGGELLDEKYGGYITSLTRDGKRYDTDKSVWFQGRCLWTFSALCNKYEARAEWMDAAASGEQFLNKYCIDTDGRMFFKTTREGLPLRKRRYMFSESFYVVGMAEYAAAAGDKSALLKAERVFGKMVAMYHDSSADPYKITPKEIAKTRSCKSIAVPMVLISSAQSLLRQNPGSKDQYSGLIDSFARDMKQFADTENKCVRETILSDGSFLNNPAGRTVNPGHCIENAWFLMNAGVLLDDNTLVKQGLQFLDWAYAIGRDETYGGIFCFVDAEGFPCEQLEWDMKLWWVHGEALVAALLAYCLTKEQKYWDWFIDVHNYCEQNFHDREYGEWYGYLHRDGSVSHTQKGSLWKGPYHLPRTLMLCEQILGNLETGQPVQSLL